MSTIYLKCPKCSSEKLYPKSKYDNSSDQECLDRLNNTVTSYITFENGEYHHYHTNNLGFWDTICGPESCDKIFCENGFKSHDFKVFITKN